MAMEFSCEACGRTFTPPAGEVMKFCSYCGKPVKLVQTEDPEVIPLADDTPPAPPPPEVKVPPVVVPPVAVPPVIVPPPVVPPPIVSPPPVTPPPGPPPMDDFELRPLSPPAPLAGPGETAAAPAGAEIDLREPVDAVTLEATRCPNCGHEIPAGAEICTECGYSRRLGRTLTTRVGSPEIPRHRSTTEVAPKSDEPTIAAERDYEEARKRKARIGSGGDSFRLFTAIFFTLAFAGALMTLPLNYLRDPAVLLPWRLPELVEGQFTHAALLLTLFLLIVVPIVTAGVRIGIALSGIESPLYLTFVRVAGTLSAVLLTAGTVFAANRVVFKLEPHWFFTAIGIEAGLALLVFTWYLQNVRFAAAMALWLYTVVFLAIACFVAGAAYAPLAGVAGIGAPWIPPVGEWFGGMKLPG